MDIEKLVEQDINKHLNKPLNEPVSKSEEIQKEYLIKSSELKKTESDVSVNKSGGSEGNLNDSLIESGNKIRSNLDIIEEKEENEESFSIYDSGRNLLEDIEYDENEINIIPKTTHKKTDKRIRKSVYAGPVPVGVVRDGSVYNRVKASRDEAVLLTKDVLCEKLKGFDLVWSQVRDVEESLRGTGSYSFRELKRAVREVQKVLDLKSKARLNDEEVMEAVAAIQRLSQAASNYYYMHRGHIVHEDGKLRKRLAESLRDATEVFFRQFGGNKLMKQALKPTFLQPGDHDPALKSEAESGMKELSGVYKKWMKHIAQNSCVASPKELLRQKLDVFAAYEKNLRIYINTHDIRTIDREYRLIIEDYKRSLIEMAAVEKADSTFSDREKKKTLGDLIDDHVYTEGEVSVKKHLEFNEDDEGLNPEQLKGIEAIDRWLIRNFNNGGAMRMFSHLRNRNGEFVSQILARSKRERLHMYYLVEKNARKNASLLDAVVSQSGDYIPNLSAFKNRMLATKWKFISHITGKYVYMNKLADAFAITENERMLSAVSDAAMITSPQTGMGPVEKRRNTLLRFYIELEDYKTLLEKYRSGSDGEMKNMDSRIRGKAQEAQKVLAELAAADDDVMEMTKEGDLRKGDVKDQSGVSPKAYSAYSDVTTQITSDTGYVTNFSRVVPKAMTTTFKEYGIGWGLSAAGWKDLLFWGGNVNTALSSISGLLSTVSGIYSLAVGHQDMSAGDITERIFGLLNSVAGTVTGTWSAVETGLNVTGTVEKALQAGESAKEIIAKTTAASSALQYAFIGTTLASGATSIVKWASLASQARNAYKANQYFERKYRNDDLIKNDDEEEIVKSKEELEKDRLKELARRREKKYDLNMSKLSDHLREKSRNSAIYSTISTGLGIAGLILPGIGPVVTSAIGAVFSITTTVLDAVKKGQVQKATFDRFFDMDNITEQVYNFKHKNDKPRDPADIQKQDKEFLKERLRRRVAAAAGFPNMAVAHSYVTGKYAEFVFNKIYDKSLPEADREGYVQFVKSLRLPVDLKKGIPSVASIKGKMMM